MGKHNKKIIDIREFSIITEEGKKTIVEGLFKTFLAGIVGYLLGKRNNNIVIKGQKDQIETLTKYLKQMKKNSSEKDRLINKLQSLSASTSSIEKLKKDFYNSTGVILP